MNAAIPAKGVIAELTSALSSPLPDSARRRGERLLQALESPVRIVLLGLEGSGKSQLVNLLAGATIVPPGERVSNLEVRWGPEWRRHETAKGPDPAAGMGHVLVEAPLANLERFSLHEVAVSGDVPDQKAAIDRAIARADMVIWCTQEFSDRERRLWADVPDALKDHSYLGLTKADVLHAAGRLDQRIDALQDVVAEEFYGLLPVATLQGLAAMASDGPDRESALIASGARAMMQTIRRHMERGRQADIDNARAFLCQHGFGAASKGDMLAAPRALSALGQSDAHKADTGEREVLNGALNLLKARSHQLAKIDAEARGEGLEELLSSCCATADELAEMFADRQCAAGSCMDELKVATGAAAEMMLLLQVEKGAGPAADAVTLLLQLNREIGKGLAA
jgi:energy-coupling factor transporter ATP-binding protein EcfA2